MKIFLSGKTLDVDSVEIKEQHLFIDDQDHGKVGFTIVIKVIEGEYNYIRKDGLMRWESI